jgi:hypothetical protein
MVELLEQVKVDEGLFHFVLQERLDYLLEETIVFLKYVEVQFMTCIFVVDFQFFFKTKLGPLDNNKIAEFFVYSRRVVICGALNLFDDSSQLFHIVNYLNLC